MCALLPSKKGSPVIWREEREIGPFRRTCGYTKERRVLEKPYFMGNRLRGDASLVEALMGKIAEIADELEL